MKMPGFNADGSLYKRSGIFHSAETRGPIKEGVCPQVSVGGGFGGRSGGLGFWCEAECDGVYALCMAACAALTEAPPVAFGCAMACTKGLKDCLDDCGGWGGWGGGGVIAW